LIRCAPTAPIAGRPFLWGRSFQPHAYRVCALGPASCSQCHISYGSIALTFAARLSANFQVGVSAHVASRVLETTDFRRKGTLVCSLSPKQLRFHPVSLGPQNEPAASSAVKKSDCAASLRFPLTPIDNGPLTKSTLQF
jgi:hypothetical protein